MKEEELRKRAICALCRRPIGRAGVPAFWLVRIERYGIDLAAVNRQQGLTMMLGGNAALAQVMGSDEEMATAIIEPITLTVCEDCCTRPVCIAQLASLVPPAEPAGPPGPPT